MMVLHPDIQDKAQAEIDSVVGDKRLPNFDDRESLPYIDALYRELMRFHGPAPLGEALLSLHLPAPVDHSAYCRRPTFFL